MPSVDKAEVRRALRLLVDPEHDVMIQSLPSGKWRVLPGSDLDELVKLVAAMSAGKGTYTTLNPLVGGLGHAAKEEDVIRRRWLLIDVDAIKDDKDASTTGDEKAAAEGVARSIYDQLRGLGWPDPLYVDSGNNYQLLYKVDLDNSKASQKLLQRCLKRLGKLFDTPHAAVDQHVHDARRICKVPGTMARKGPDTPDRPHRMARIVYEPTPVLCVFPGQLEELAGPEERPEPKGATLPPRDPWTTRVGGNDDARYAQRALEGEVYKVTTAGTNRNHQLYESALKLAGFIASGMLDEQEVRHALTQAAHACGLGQDGDPHEVERAIANGFDVGKQNPRTPPPRDEATGKAKGKADEKPEDIPEGTRRVVRVSDVESKEVSWLWPQRIPHGFITIMAGQSGVGKSFVTLNVVAGVTTGGEMPDRPGEYFPKGNVLIFTEDPHEQVIRPRLEAMGADLDHVYCVTYDAMDFYNLSDTGFLHKAWEEAGEPSLIVIDPPSNFLGGVDEHRNGEVRGTLKKIVKWINDRGGNIAVVMITHVSKPSGKSFEALNRVIGSVAWGSTARVAHMLLVDPEDPKRCLFIPMKINVGPLAKGLAYHVVPTGKLAAVEWLGEVDTTADEAVQAEPRKGRGPAPAKTLEKAEWLYDHLQLFGGTLAISACIDAAGDKGFLGEPDENGDYKSLNPLYRAKDAVPQLPPPRDGKKVETLPRTDTAHKRWTLVDFVTHTGNS